MKQRITFEQLNELTEEQKARLRDWWKPARHDAFVADAGKQFQVKGDSKDPLSVMCSRPRRRSDGGYRPYFKYKSGCLPLLSIGQCIELLNGPDKNNDYGLLGKIECRPFNNGKVLPGCVSWIIHRVQQGTLEVIIFDGCYSKELIDALWEAVKAIL